VVPSSLQEYRTAHQFIGPCCLCPLFEPEGRAIFTEAAIFIATFGPFAGEYVAKCAKGDCGYLGQFPCNSDATSLTLYPYGLVLLERIYPRYEVPVKKYPLRGRFSRSSWVFAKLINFVDPAEPIPLPVYNALEVDLEIQLQKSCKR
jgi:hypothetical protein